jgi:hypothetical protein
MQVPHSIHRFLNRLHPYQSLVVLAVPLAIVEPLKLIALFVISGSATSFAAISDLAVSICYWPIFAKGTSSPKLAP